MERLISQERIRIINAICVPSIILLNTIGAGNVSAGNCIGSAAESEIIFNRVRRIPNKVAIGRCSTTVAMVVCVIGCKDKESVFLYKIDLFFILSG